MNPHDAAHDTARNAAANVAYPDPGGRPWNRITPRRAPRLTVPDRPSSNWAEHGACRGKDPELFYGGDDRGRISPRQAAPAKAICAGCPVKAECLQWALDTDERFGVWGGRTPAERAAMLRPAGRPARTRSSPP